MHNPIAPAVEIEIGGDTRHLLLDFNAIAAAESATGKNYLTIGALSRPGGADVTALLWGALLHETPELTLREVRSWVSYANIVTITNKVYETINACFPKAQDPAREDG